MKTSKRIRYISAITLFTFFINVMLPFYAVYDIPKALASEQLDANQNASLFGEKILICTAEGFKLVSLADLQSGKEQPKKHPQYKCALCYAAAHGTNHIVDVQEAEHIYYGNYRSIAYKFSNYIIASQLSSRDVNTRAPPVIA